ncbi:glycoside hydrolase family 78 protein [Coprobacter sp. LH1063]|uniref:alpha-L-rhamnosidase n=1 Tax=Coprobacter tertius TaxID=2944915 RepID=A0ABT1MLL3_9BACT|nr:alpha-L-rhamnosidase [Coprobacter tertius]MCP9612608.1 glycoside hydrolase family 78 protein [Coprobacter tertius]
MLIVLCTGMSVVLPSLATAGVKLKNLRVEMQNEPLGLEIKTPRFMWQLSSHNPGLVQKSYRIVVAENPSDLKKQENLLWDSGEVFSDNMLFIPYAGKPLSPGKDYYWKVRVKTNQGRTDWSDVKKWSTGLGDGYDWQADWIGVNKMMNHGETRDGHTRLAARYLRKEFDARKKVSRAVLYICGLGSYEAYLNGIRIGDAVLSPAPAHYTVKTYYNVYDVTGMIGKGCNALAVVLGNGRYFGLMPGMEGYGLPRLKARLEIEYDDGTFGRVVSDNSWRASSQGPVIANNEFDGEEYDARKEFAGWDKAGYNDSGWEFADIMQSPGGKLCAQATPCIKVMEEISPVSVKLVADDTYIVDMGQNMVGRLQVTLSGKAGEPVSFRFAETLKDDGSLYIDNLRTARARNLYIPAKNGSFTWEPSFVYHGFRYVEIKGVKKIPSLSALKGKVIYDEMETTGSFETSNEMINRIYRNAYWGIRGNYRGMPTDCPQRDERLGWLGDRATGSYGESFVFGNALLYKKWLQDIEDSQLPSGSISDVSPCYWKLYFDDVTWPSAYFYIADMLYRQYGDKSGIEEHYGSMKRWIEHIRKVGIKDGIVVRDQFGDWCMPPESQELIHSKDPSRKTDGRILSTCVFYDLLHLMDKFARMTGNEADGEEYLLLADSIKKAYNKMFFDIHTASYGNNTVTANLLSLRLGLVPAGHEERVFENIIKKTQQEFGGHISTGVVGIQHLMRGLTDNGAEDLAYKLAVNDTYPSWGYMVKKGATTIWELWNGDTADPAMNSANHVMLLGDLIIWYYENLAGIKCTEHTVGFRKIEMAPCFPEGLDYVKASYSSVSGEIKSEWRKSETVFDWKVTIPGNTSAVIRVPIKFCREINRQDGMRNVYKDRDYWVVETGSGNYRFVK